MPRKPWRIKPRKATLSGEVRSFLQTGETPPLDYALYALSRNPDHARKLWQHFRQEILSDWIEQRPCTRPWCWWLHGGPAEPVPGWPGFQAAQRRRVGGTGQATHEVSASWGGFSFGIPLSWLDADGAEIFGGVALHEADPPTFESEAAYLQRHGLLSGAERAHLAAHLELLEPEFLSFE